MKNLVSIFAGHDANITFYNADKDEYHLIELERLVKKRYFRLHVDNSPEYQKEILTLCQEIAEEDWGIENDYEAVLISSDGFIQVDPKEIFNTSAGSWISRGSGQESLISLRSPVLTGSGACGSFLILEDGLPIRPAGFCNVNNLFEVSLNLASNIEILKGPSSARFGGNALHGAINIETLRVDGTNYLKTEINNEESFKSTFAYQESKNWTLGISLGSNKGFRDDSGYDEQKFAFKSFNRII